MTQESSQIIICTQQTCEALAQKIGIDETQRIALLAVLVAHQMPGRAKMLAAMEKADTPENTYDESDRPGSHIPW